MTILIFLFLMIIVLAMLFLTSSLFLLAEHKEEIWEEIWEDDNNTRHQKRK